MLINLLSLVGSLIQSSSATTVMVVSFVNAFRKELKGQNFRDVDAGAYSYQLGVYYMDFISECEKLGDYLMNVDQAGILQNNDHDDPPLRR